MSPQSAHEYEAWKKLCDMLLTRHVVTQDDLDSPFFDNTTPGRRLLNQIRKWGNAHTALLTNEEP